MSQYILFTCTVPVFPNKSKNVKKEKCKNVEKNYFTSLVKA